jgi:hypothetical protein
MTVHDARHLGYIFTRDETGRWYIAMTHAHVINRNGLGYSTQSEAIEALADALEPLELEGDTP